MFGISPETRWWLQACCVVVAWWGLHMVAVEIIAALLTAGARRLRGEVRQPATGP